MLMDLPLWAANYWYHTIIFFPGQLAFCKKAVVGLAARRIFWIVQWSEVEWSGKIRLKLYLCLLSHTFSVLVYYRYCHTRRAWYIHVRYTEISKFNLFININTVTRGAHDIDICTCILWEFLTLTYCFV